MVLKRVIASSLLFVAAGVAHAGEHRQLGAHEHGHGTLNIAIEGKTVTMELEVPGDDIVGFEHEAITTADKAAVEAASITLTKALDIFKVPARAGCRVKDAKVNLQAEKDDDEADAAKTKDGAPASHQGHDEGHAEHKEFHVVYALECTEPAGLTTIDFDYFKNFARSQKLTVNVITGKGQSSFEITREKPQLNLGGLV